MKYEQGEVEIRNSWDKKTEDLIPLRMTTMTEAEWEGGRERMQYSWIQNRCAGNIEMLVSAWYLNFRTIMGGEQLLGQTVSPRTIIM